MKLVLIGFIIGIAKILPGVSGAMLAMMFEVYELLINSVADLKYAYQNKWKLLKLSLGIIASIIIFSIFFKIFMHKYYIYFISAVLLVMIYELIKDLNTYKKEKISVKYLIVSCFFVLVLISVMFFKKDSIVLNETPFHFFLSLLLCGIVDSIATIVPGISGTALLLLLGYYQTILTGFSDLDLSIILPFGMGFALGIIVFSKIFAKIFKKYKTLMHYIVTVLSIWSTITLLITTINQLFPV